MDIPCLQTLINNKDWDELAKTDIIMKHNFNVDDHKGLSISKEFILDFFMNKKFYDIIRSSQGHILRFKIIDKYGE